MLVSAVTNQGVDGLRRAVSERMTAGNRVYTLKVAIDDGASLAWLHEYGEVLNVGQTGEEGTMLTVDARLSDAAYARFMAR